MANKQMKMFSTSLISEIKIKIAMRKHYIPTRLAKIKKTNNTKGYWQCGATRTLIYW